MYLNNLLLLGLHQNSCLVRWSGLMSGWVLGNQVHWPAAGSSDMGSSVLVQWLCLTPSNHFVFELLCWWWCRSLCISSWWQCFRQQEFHDNLVNGFVAGFQFLLWESPNQPLQPPLGAVKHCTPVTVDCSQSLGTSLLLNDQALLSCKRINN